MKPADYLDLALKPCFETNGASFAVAILRQISLINIDNEVPILIKEI